MKLVTVLTTDGESREFTLAPEATDALIVAQAAQVPAHPIRVEEDGSTLHLNTRHVIGIAVEDAPEPTTDPDPEHDPDRTVAQLKEALDAAGIEYPSTALKADLQELARNNNV